MRGFRTKTAGFPLFDHCPFSATEICTVFRQTCDGMDTITQAEELPKLEIDDLVYTEDIGAHSKASSTWFNGFAPARLRT